MKRVSRRAFFGRVSSPEPVPAPPEAPSTTCASGFSLEAFYAARGPQKLPPIVIRPSVLHYAAELTAVGCPPPHAPPSLEDDPLYTQLAAANAVPARGDDEPRS